VPTKRGYSRQFTPRTDTYGRYLLDKVPATLWADVRAKCKRHNLSVRALILTLLHDWVTEGQAPHRCKFCGLPSWVDPADQVAPPAYCHPIDHGKPE
jgi:hypothetical protein